MVYRSIIAMQKNYFPMIFPQFGKDNTCKDKHQQISRMLSPADTYTVELFWTLQ